MQSGATCEISTATIAATIVSAGAGPPINTAFAGGLQESWSIRSAAAWSLALGTNALANSNIIILVQVNFITTTLLGLAHLDLVLIVMTDRIRDAENSHVGVDAASSLTSPPKRFSAPSSAEFLEQLNNRDVCYPVL